MPMHMWHHVAETSEVDLVGLDDFTHGGFHCEYHVHQTLALFLWQIGHFLSVLVQDDAAEAGIIGVVDPDHTTVIVMPEHFSKRRGLA